MFPYTSDDYPDLGDATWNHQPEKISEDTKPDWGWTDTPELYDDYNPKFAGG